MINLIENNYVQRQKLENGQTIYCLHNTKINLVEKNYIVKIRNTKHTVIEQKFKSKSQNYYLNTKKNTYNGSSFGYNNSLSIQYNKK